MVSIGLSSAIDLNRSPLLVGCSFTYLGSVSLKHWQDKFDNTLINNSQTRSIINDHHM